MTMVDWLLTEQLVAIVTREEGAASLDMDVEYRPRKSRG